ncbi:MAG: DNA polymerase III subunit delta [Actinomycetota bacterium]
MRALTVIMGDSEFLVDEEYKRVRDHLLGSGQTLEEVSADDDEAVANALDTPSLFGGGRLIALRGNATALDAHKDRLIRFAEDPIPDTSVVVVTWGAQKLKKALGTRAEIFEVQAPKPWETAAWLVKHAKGKKRPITGEAAELLVELLGSDLRELASAYDQLSLGVKGSIDAATVTASFRGGQGSALYTFLDAVLLRDRASSLQHLQSLMAAGDHPLVVHAALVKQFRALAACAGQDRNSRPSAKELDVAQGYINRAGKHERRWDNDSIRRALVALAEADLALKGGFDGEDAPPELIIELLVIELTASREERASLRPASRR